MPGRHNLLNALGAVAVGLEVGVPFAKIASGFEDFRGAERRFQLRGEARGVMVVDDYGHHPTEIAAVIAAARAGLDRRVVVVFQPHRYTRTRDLLEAFGAALGAADEIVLTDIYSAGEAPIPGATAEAVEAVVRQDRASRDAGQGARRPAGRGGEDGAAQRPRDHARRRLDRQRCRIGFWRRSKARAAEAGGEGG